MSPLPSTDVDPSWLAVLSAERQRPYYAPLQQFVAADRAAHNVYPPSATVFRALEVTPLPSVRAVVLGQDPYHRPGQAHGLSFSVPAGVAAPPSLKNIFRELSDDQGIARSTTGNLEGWARQGVLLLNAVLTVREGMPGSHQKRGWEEFTDAVLAEVNRLPHSVAFVLWGAHAQKKAGLLDARHLQLRSPHPSPLSAHRGFFGSRPFSKINSHLKQQRLPEIDWSATS